MLTNSWIVVDRKTNKAVFETWSKRVVEQINLTRYQVFTAHEYLVRFNRGDFQ